MLVAWEERQRAIEARQAAAPRPAAPPPPAAPAAPEGPTAAQLATAQRFVAAASKRNETGALAELTADVRLETPQGSYSGKVEVARAVREQAAQGSSGGLGQPVINGSRIVAPGRVGAFSVITIFEFTGSKISRMIVRLNEPRRTGCERLRSRWTLDRLGRAAEPPRGRAHKGTAASFGDDLPFD